jgi:nicotinamide riboside kinase
MGKIAVLFTGAGSTGKTTLLKIIKEQFEKADIHCSYITEFVRDLVRQGIIGEVDINATNHNQVVITSELMCQYWEKLQDDNTLLIAERTPICTLAYSRNRKDSTEYVNKLNERFLKNVFNYKDVKFIVFYFPPIIPFQKDMVRAEEGRSIIDEEILKILEEFNIEYIPLLKTDLDRRVVEVLTIINDELKNIQVTSRT